MCCLSYGQILHCFLLQILLLLMIVIFFKALLQYHALSFMSFLIHLQLFCIYFFICLSKQSNIIGQVSAGADNPGKQPVFPLMHMSVGWIMGSRRTQYSPQCLGIKRREDEPLLSTSPRSVHQPSVFSHCQIGLQIFLSPF